MDPILSIQYTFELNVNTDMTGLLKGKIYKRKINWILGYLIQI